MYEDFTLDYTIGSHNHKTTKSEKAAPKKADKAEAPKETIESPVEETVSSESQAAENIQAGSGVSFADLPDDDGTAAEMKEKMAEMAGTDEGEKKEEEKAEGPDLTTTVNVNANGRMITLTGKENYVYVDVFDKLNFDLKAGNGRKIITKLNGKNAQYLEPIKDGDVIEVRWEEK